MRRFGSSAIFLLFIACGPSDLQFREPQPIKPAQATEVSATFESISLNILQPKCATCHKPGSQSGIDLTSYDGVLDQTAFPPVVTVESPEESSLYLTIRDGKMPKDLPRLSDKEIQAVYDWIKLGAKNDR